MGRGREGDGGEMVKWVIKSILLMDEKVGMD